MTNSHCENPCGRSSPARIMQPTYLMALLPAFLALVLLGFGCGGDDDGGPTPDTTPPAAASDLSVTAVTDSSATLEWTAPGDDGTNGTASAYDVRYATDMIRDQNWGAADSVETPPVPQSAGSDEVFTVDGLSSGTSYYFALKTVDDASNWSELSNVVSDTTTGGSEPEEPVMFISPDSLDLGSEEDEAVFTITNVGAGTLVWTVAEDETWLTVGPDSGSTTTEADEITVTVDRDGLDPGDYSGTVTVTPNLGDPEQVSVDMAVAYIPPPPPMVQVPAGTFIMGDGVTGCGEDEHEVTLTRDFYLSQHEVTNQEYLEAVQWAYDHGYVTATTSSVRDNLDGSTEELLDLDNDYSEIQFDGAGSFYLRESPSSYAQNAYPGGYDPSDHPVKEVSWYGSVRYCDWLSLLDGLPRAYEHSGDWSCNGGDPYGAAGYRLPTDAEWEFAAQWDDERIYPWGDEDPDCSRANFDDYYGTGDYCVGWTSPVGSYPDAPEALGLSDMGGNVWEWCDDWWVCHLGTAPVTDPTGPSSGYSRVLRGGSSYDGGSILRCAFRGNYGHPGNSHSRLGFRAARTVTP